MLGGLRVDLAPCELGHHVAQKDMLGGRQKQRARTGRHGHAGISGILAAVATQSTGESATPVKSPAVHARLGAMPASPSDTERHDDRKPSTVEPSAGKPKRALAVLLAFATAGSCQAVPDAPSPAAVATPLPGATPSGPALDFPPAQIRRERRPLPRTLRTNGTDAEIAIVSPELDDDGAFEFAGQTLRISFNAPLGFDLAAATPPLQIEPPVPGKLQSKDGHAIEFVADAPFDPEATYTASLTGLKNAAGLPVFEGWTGRFRADPQGWIGGKMLSYLPKPGAPRIVMIAPDGGTELGVKPSFDLLFDQPIDPAAAIALVELQRKTAGGSKPVALKARRGSKGVFGGVKVDRRHLVTLSPRAPLDPGTALTLVRRDPDVGEYEAKTSYEVAERMGMTGVECWSSDCSFAKDTLHLSGGSFSI
ncbi:MAG: hypothetical protein JNK45_16175, partial [Myxococcales bacterium]|nr:hypothetical protein [Myxococcales bacterium]